MITVSMQLGVCLMELMVLLSAGVRSGRETFFTLNYTTAYFLCIAAFVFALICSVRVKTTFAKYSRTSNRKGVRAYEVAREILDRNGLYNVQIARIGGHLTDNYNPSTNVVSLSDSVYNSTSLAAIGVAAHECGHAVQHARGYVPIKIRGAIFPVVQLGSSCYFIIFILGLLLNFGFLVNLGIALFGLVVVFQLVTLPVEFNASARAMSTLRSEGILAADELPAARKTLTAAAMTYVASLLVSFTQLLRLIASSNRRR